MPMWSEKFGWIVTRSTYRMYAVDVLRFSQQKDEPVTVVHDGDYDRAIGVVSVPTDVIE